MGNNNQGINVAKTAKKDEFYTQLTDIERELKNYKQHFKGKTIFCNCDDPRESKFYVYFAQNFDYLGLKRLIATHYKEDGNSYKLEIINDDNNDGKINALDTIETPLQGNGDFRSEECVAILKEADIVITNPPFSLFREYVAQLIEHDKKFIIVGHQNAIKYKELFPLLAQDKMWMGMGFKGGAAHFINKHYEDYASSGDHIEGMIRVSGVAWFANLEHNKRLEEVILYKKYNEIDYPKYDTYDAINVNKVKEIPMDYFGEMGVPITFMHKYNPNQFEIVGILNGAKKTEYNFAAPKVNGENIFTRIVIKRK